MCIVFKAIRRKKYNGPICGLMSPRPFQLNIFTFDGDIHQMRLKDSRLLGEFFSFQAHARSLISFSLERACQGAG